MDLGELNPFYLVGGTALSLQFGHRISIDLDLFSTEAFENENIIKVLEKKFGNQFKYEGGTAKFGIFCFIDDIKVDIIKYPHPIVFNTIQKEGIRMYDCRDIAAMKIQAIFGRGKKKDFWDIAELLKKYALEELIMFHTKKYPSHQLLISIPQALTYFEDAEESEDPISLKGQTWESVKKIIQQHVNDYLK
jgi:predicted nucleotidyltransferase component of viral defense system